jgi:hypothetical protein
MPTWSEIATELDAVFRQRNVPPFDIVRRKYLSSLYALTGRNCILYATNWTQPGKDPNAISINEEDIQGLMEVIHGLHGRDLDLILHSPGGSPEAAAAIVSYLRSKFDDIRVIIPHTAMSAATMISCASNKIVMGRHSFIGPIDPQFIMQTPLGIMSVPAQAILDQFEMAKAQCKDPQILGAWLPILNQYGPALLIQSQNAIELSRKYASEWLTQFMFAAETDRDRAKKKADDIADRLSNHALFKSHSHHISCEEARRIGLIVEELEANQDLQDLVLSIYHATTHTFNGTPAVKIIENQNGKAYIRVQAMPAQIVQQQLPPQQQPPQPPHQAPKPPAP